MIDTNQKSTEGTATTSWLETQICASVAASMLARAEYFALLEDAMVSPGRLGRALTAWKQHANQAYVLGGMVR